MKKNPKTILGVILLIILLTGAGFMAGRVSDTVGKVNVERSLTPTPLPPYGNVMAVTPDPSAPTPEPVLRTGSTGQAVTDLQSRLYTLKYYSGVIDGQYGPGTKEAVTLFQRANDLIADGICGSETKNLLFSASAKPNPFPVTPDE